MRFILLYPHVLNIIPYLSNFKKNHKPMSVPYMFFIAGIFAVAHIMLYPHFLGWRWWNHQLGTHQMVGLACNHSRTWKLLKSSGILEIIPHIQTIIPLTVYHKYIAYVFMYDCICATTDARKTKTDVCTYNHNVYIYICTHARMDGSNTLFQEFQTDPGDSMSNTTLPSICTLIPSPKHWTPHKWI